MNKIKFRKMKGKTKLKTTKSKTKQLKQFKIYMNKAIKTYSKDHSLDHLCIKKKVRS